MAVVLVSATLALAVGLVAERGQRDGMYLWAAALAVQTLAYVLLSSHGGMPIGPSLVAAGVLMSVSLALSGEALCQFHLRRPRRWLLWGPVSAALLCFALLLHNPPARMLVVPAIFSLQIAILLDLQQRARAKTVGRGQYFVFAALVLLLVVLASRFVAALQGTPALADFGALSPTQMLTFVGVLVSTFDERRTTVTADRALIEAGIGAQARRKLVDKVAAAVLLQTWLDSRAGQR